MASSSVMRGDRCLHETDPDNKSGLMPSGERLKSHGVVFHEGQIALHMLTRLEIDLHFELTCEFGEGGKFDDIALIDRNDGGRSTARLIQVKHKDVRKKIDMKCFLKAQDNYSVLHYLESAEREIKHSEFEKKTESEIKVLELLTNADYTEKVKKLMKIEPDGLFVGETVYQLNEKNDYIALRNAIETEAKDHKGNVKDRKGNVKDPKPIVMDDKTKAFFKKFKLSVNRPDGEDLKKLIKKKIESCMSKFGFSCKDVDFVYDILMGKISSFHIDPNVKMVDGATFKKWLEDASKCRKDIFLEYHNSNMNLLRNNELRFRNNSLADVDVDREEPVLVIQSHTCSDITLPKLAATLEDRNKKFYLITDEQLIQSEATTVSESVDLVVVQRGSKSVLDDFSEAIRNVSEHKKIVVVTDGSEQFDETWRRIEDRTALADFDDESRELLGRKIIKFQGQKIEFARINVSLVESYVRDEVLSYVFNERLEIPENFVDSKPSEMAYYVDRTVVQEGHVKLEELVRYGDTVVVEKDIINHFTELGVYFDRTIDKELAHRDQVPRMQERSNQVRRNQVRRDRMRRDRMRRDRMRRGQVFLIAIDCDGEDQFKWAINHFNKYPAFGAAIQFVRLNVENEHEHFKQLCEENRNAIAVWLYSNNNELYLRETGDTLERNNINVETTYVDVPRLQCIDDHVLLVAESGMGKSALLSVLATRSILENPDIWVIKIDLQDYWSYFGLMVRAKRSFSDEGTVVEFLAETQKLKKETFDSLLFCSYFKFDRKLVVLLDGFDKIAPYYRELVTGLMQGLKCIRGIRLWIAAQPREAYYLETHLHLRPFRLVEFTPAEQRSFLERFWHERFDIEESRRERATVFIDHLLKSARKLLHAFNYPITGIPVQCRMLAEIYQKTFEGFYKSDADDTSLPSLFDILKHYRRLIDGMFREEFKKKGKFDPTSMKNRRRIEKESRQLMKKNKVFTIFTAELGPFVSEEEHKNENTCIIFSMGNSVPLDWNAFNFSALFFPNRIKRNWPGRSQDFETGLKIDPETDSKTDPETDSKTDSKTDSMLLLEISAIDIYYKSFVTKHPNHRHLENESLSNKRSLIIDSLNLFAYYTQQHAKSKHCLVDETNPCEYDDQIVTDQPTSIHEMLTANRADTSVKDNINEWKLIKPQYNTNSQQSNYEFDEPDESSGFIGTLSDIGASRNRIRDSLQSEPDELDVKSRTTTFQLEASTQTVHLTETIDYSRASSSGQ